MSVFIERALVRSAEAIAKRPLTQLERDRLLQTYRRATGTERQRSERALRDLFGWSDDEFQLRASKSDDTGKAIDDLVAEIVRNPPGKS